MESEESSIGPVITVNNDFGPILSLVQTIHDLIDKMDDYISLSDIFICVPVDFHDGVLVIPPKQTPIRVIGLPKTVETFTFDVDVPYHRKGRFIILLAPVNFTLKLTLDVGGGVVNIYYGAW